MPAVEGAPSSYDPETDRIVSEFSAPDRTFRDPVHKDIVVNHLEARLIDTSTVQRLRRIRQLGTAHLVYHGADHSRFQHSLGTLQMTHLLIENAERNARQFSTSEFFTKLVMDPKLSAALQRFTLTTRLAALLHDVVVIPYSHTLEKEGGLFKMQWADLQVTKECLGPDEPLAKAIADYTAEIRAASRTQVTSPSETLEKYESPELANEIATSLLATVLSLMRWDKLGSNREAHESEVAATFGRIPKQWPFLDWRLAPVASQVVSDTVSADLLDYVRRDFYFCGIRKDYDDRFLRYSCVAEDERRELRFAFRIVNKRNEIKPSVLNALLDLMELRYAIADAIHMHPAKNCSSAMIIEAVSFFIDSSEGDAAERLIAALWRKGDDEFLSDLLSAPTCPDVTKKLLRHYLSRRTYKCHVYMAGWEQDGKAYPQVVEKLRDPKRRLKLERVIANWLHIDPGDFLLYATPDPSKLTKVLATNVYFLDGESGVRKPVVTTLHDLANQADRLAGITRNQEALGKLLKSKMNYLDQAFEGIWKAYFFLAEPAESKHDAVEALLAHLLKVECSNVPSKRTFADLPHGLVDAIHELMQAKTHRIALNSILDLPNDLAWK
jgi:HD superfamily phosphohydrolase